MGSRRWRPCVGLAVLAALACAPLHTLAQQQHKHNEQQHMERSQQRRQQGRERQQQRRRSQVLAELGFRPGGARGGINPAAGGIVAPPGALLDPYQRTELFHSPRCRNFYPGGREGEMLVWESRRAGGDTHLTEVVYCPAQGLVFVDNAKAGSTTVRDLLEREFGCTWRTHSQWPEEQSTRRRAKCHTKTGELLSDESCTSHKKSRTDWLDDSVVSDAFFWSTVREPIARFKSGYRQALVMRPELRNLTISDYLVRFRSDMVNGHTQTQARMLSGRDATGQQVPMHFIASLENLEHDLTVLWSELAFPPFAQLPKSNTAEEDPFKNGLDTALSAEQIRELCGHLMQDYVCFGYPLPPECR